MDQHFRNYKYRFELNTQVSLRLICFCFAGVGVTWKQPNTFHVERDSFSIICIILIKIALLHHEHIFKH